MPSEVLGIKLVGSAHPQGPPPLATEGIDGLDGASFAGATDASAGKGDAELHLALVSLLRPVSLDL